MKEDELIEILKRYKNGQTTAEENAFLEDWYIQHRNDDQEEYSADNLLDDAGAVWVNLEKDYAKPVKIIAWRRVAAVAATLLLIAGGMFFFNEKQPAAGVTAQNIRGGDIRPGKNTATLTLSSGRKIILSDEANGKLAEDAGITITKAADGKVVYKVNELTGETALTLNTLSTARGEQYQIVLPDGTVAWLNAASSLKFPSTFANAGKRSVELTGEAYFEVAKDKDHPFVVKTNTQLVEVLGTHFNINAYAEDPSVKTTLLEGMVRVASFSADGNEAANAGTILKPGQQSVLRANRITVNEVNADAMVAWKDGNFMFRNDESLENIMQQITRWYDVEVVYQDDVKSKTFWGSVTRYSNVSKVLDLLEAAGSVHFKVEGRRITVMK